MRLTVALLHVLAIVTQSTHQRPPVTAWRKAAVCALVPLFWHHAPAVLAAETLRDQLLAVQRLQTEQQKQRVLEEERRLEAETNIKTIVIARGIVSVAPTGLAYGVDASLFPFGIENPASLDPALGNPRAALFITAVGRQGPPVAARRVPLATVQFPYVFALTDADLIFPYTTAAWLQSPLSSDAVALTAVLDADGVLATPDEADRFGFSISDPIRGGRGGGGGNLQQWTEAKISINLKSDGKPYSPDEVELLGRIDSETTSRKER